ncbi:hypothetical protein [Actinomadura sp. 9N407]|uniref:hypothetical protein n=1 Tax=Actinomadura sp. 9N407 TaxID=3375154 RepID=UPI00379CD84C
MIPIYTTDGVPLANSGPIEEAWPVWIDSDSIGPGLDQLAHLARQRNAHAIVALKITTYWLSGGNVQDYIPRARHVLFGTAVTLGEP